MGINHGEGYYETSDEKICLANQSSKIGGFVKSQTEYHMAWPVHAGRRN
jgi:hypothetical protein